MWLMYPTYPMFVRFWKQQVLASSLSQRLKRSGVISAPKTPVNGISSK